MTTTSPPTPRVSPEQIASRSVRPGLRSRLRPVIPWLALVVLYIVTVLVAPGYLKGTQIASLLELATILGIAAIGQTAVILVGGIDVSIGATMTLANVVSAAVLNGHDGILPQAIVVTLLIGAVTGAVNGLVIVVFRIPDLIVTLATMTILLGVGFLFTNGSPAGSSAPGLTSFVTKTFTGVFSPAVILWIVLAAVAIVALRLTTFGRRIYAIGLNRIASRASGVNVSGTVVVLYIVAGLAAGLGGLLLTGYTGSAYLGSGNTYQLATIAAVVLGGASIFGGRGGYGGTIAGVLLTTLLLSLLQVVGVPQAGQNIAYGLAILVMLVLFTRRRSAG